MTYPILTPILRHALQAIGGFLVAMGYLDESMMDSFIGLGVNAGAFAWWAFDRYFSVPQVRDGSDEPDYGGSL